MYRKSYFPGSTFKVVTASVGVDRAGVTGDQPVYPPASEFDIDFTDNELENFGGVDVRRPAVRDPAAELQHRLRRHGRRHQRRRRTWSPAPRRSGSTRGRRSTSRPPAASTFPTEFPDDQGNGPLARASIGQGDVSATPLQMALVAAGVANDGRVMAPHVLDRVTDDRQEVVEEFDEEVWTEAMSASSAAVVREAMVGVVTDGSGGRAAIPGFVVGGKTGTAQLGTDAAVEPRLVHLLRRPPRRHARGRGGRAHRGPAGRQRGHRRPARGPGRAGS